MDYKQRGRNAKKKPRKEGRKKKNEGEKGKDGKGKLERNMNIGGRKENEKKRGRKEIINEEDRLMTKGRRNENMGRQWEGKGRVKEVQKKE